MRYNIDFPKGLHTETTRSKCVQYDALTRAKAIVDELRDAHGLDFMAYNNLLGALAVKLLLPTELTDEEIKTAIRREMGL